MGNIQEVLIVLIYLQVSSKNQLVATIHVIKSPPRGKQLTILPTFPKSRMNLRNFWSVGVGDRSTNVYSSRLHHIFSCLVKFFSILSSFQKSTRWTNLPVLKNSLWMEKYCHVCWWLKIQRNRNYFISGLTFNRRYIN